MTKEEIIEIGMQAGISKPVLLLGNNLKLLTAFAKLVAEKEREACAKMCDVLAVHPEYASNITKLAAQAIRNRRQV